MSSRKRVMINEMLGKQINLAVIEAKKNKADVVMPEEIVIKLLENDQTTRKLFEAAGLEVTETNRELKAYLEKYCYDTNSNLEVDMSDTAEEVLNNAVYATASTGKDEVSCERFVYEAYQAVENIRDIFDDNGFDLTEFRVKATNMLDNDSDEDEDEDGVKPVSLLEEFTTNVTQKARDGEIDPIIGRNKELQRTIQILSRKSKNNPLHVGLPGVGKTAITNGLALKIINDDVPDCLKDTEIYSIEMGSMLAGTKYRGDFEERLKKLLKEIQSLDNAILFIDEIHTIVGAGASQSGSMDAANMLKPLLTEGKLKVIGATTDEEYRKYFEKDAALSRRFQKVAVNEPSQEDTLKILKGLKASYENFHNITYTDNVLKYAIEMSVKFINNRYLPDKAIDLIDEAGARTKLSNKKKVTTQDIDAVISLVANIPDKNMKKNDLDILMNLEDNIKTKIFGQDEAIKAVVKQIKRSKSGLDDRDKPIASCLFVGPTGTGKTELCKQLSEEFDIPLVRFDMSEYSEKGSVAKLIGTAPGYVGYENGGVLVKKLKNTPSCILLLDEIEKAHDDIYNILLQVMDYGTLSDNEGNKIDCKNVILIMTSNCGAAEVGRTKIGLTNKTVNSSNILETVKKKFKPEFRNRLDSIVVFNKLSKDMLKKVAVREISSLTSKLNSKGIEVTVNDDVYDKIVTEAEKTFGAREVVRLVDSEIKDYFVDLLFSDFDKKPVVVEVEDDKFKFEIKK